jgi:energy-converting hydrogenase Eha subunit H
MIHGMLELIAETVLTYCAWPTDGTRVWKFTLFVGLVAVTVVGIVAAIAS